MEEVLDEYEVPEYFTKLLAVLDYNIDPNYGIMNNNGRYLLHIFYLFGVKAVSMVDVITLIPLHSVERIQEELVFPLIMNIDYCVKNFTMNLYLINKHVPSKLKMYHMFYHNGVENKTKKSYVSPKYIKLKQFLSRLEE